ncbi:hypothetical protein LZ198_28795 [Myxococcus sp. K15C18031901]|uniref:hypothetical protein n=1 Tax=Myxococcus dinghuensis TaxID=2906761 RepID=UPI0020A7DE8E|nr:hypothetical protein [Myxococcus dinghuensis]MCP3102882.1 hypothetical protein [Myxococcus dinghuensis]
MTEQTSPTPVGITDAAYHLPGPAIDIVEWASSRGVDPQLVQELLANGCRYFHEGPEHSDAELIAGAIDQLAARGARLSDVRYLVHAHTQAFSMPAPPSSLLTELVRRYGMSPRLCFSVGHIACAGVVGAMDWAARLLADDDDARYALVVTSDRVFGKAKHRIRQDAGIQSDGASAVLLAKEDLRCRVGAVSYKNFAELHEGPSNPRTTEMIGRYTWLHTKLLFEEHSQATGIPLREYGQLLPINADRHYWVQIADTLGLPDTAFFLENIRERGHACSNDFAVNLVDRGFPLLAQGRAVASCGQSNVGAYAVITLLPPSHGATAQGAGTP